MDQVPGKDIIKDSDDPQEKYFTDLTCFYPFVFVKKNGYEYELNAGNECLIKLLRNAGSC